MDYLPSQTTSLTHHHPCGLTHHKSFVSALKALHAPGAEHCFIDTPFMVNWAIMMLHEPDVSRTAYFYYTVCHGAKWTDHPELALPSEMPNLYMCNSRQGKRAIKKAVSKRLSDGTVLLWDACKHTTIDPHLDIPRKVSPMFWVPKRGISIDVEIREIQHMSAPLGNAPNDLPNPTSFVDDLKYTTVRQAARDMGFGDFMFKEDVRWGYKNVWIHPSCLSLMGFALDGVYYVDATLPFGLRLAPWIFSGLTNILRNAAVRTAGGLCKAMHVYLDDFLGIATDESKAEAVRQILITTLESVDWSMNATKTVLPTQQCEFLAVVMDSILMALYLSPDRIAELHQVIQKMCKFHSRVGKKLVERFCGVMNWTAEVVGGVRTFMRSWITAMNKVKLSNHMVSVTSVMTSDLDILSMLLDTCNLHELKSVIKCDHIPITHNTVDACGFGLGGFFNGKVWQFHWPDEVIAHSDIKELVDRCPAQVPTCMGDM